MKLLNSLRMLILTICVVVGAISSVFADGPADNRTDIVRRLPKPGIEVPEEIAQRWQEQLASLSEKIARIKAIDDSRRDLWPDVAIFH